ncbi:hypothetical protein CGBL_0119670 [Corynebacterium glutamicum]|nr:hypothetical protein CGBL_0119670 [Corynebacterium glutamicum]
MGICVRFEALKTTPECPRSRNQRLVGTVVWSRLANTQSDQTGVPTNLKFHCFCHVCPVYQTKNRTGVPKLPTNRKSCHACLVPARCPLMKSGTNRRVLGFELPKPLPPRRSSHR